MVDRPVGLGRVVPTGEAVTCVNCGCDPTVLSRGHRINRHAFLSSQILLLREHISKTEKLARRTPAKTLVEEWRKVRVAQESLPVLRAQLVEIEEERTTLEAMVRR